MWGSYHQIQCSNEFKIMWKEFLHAASCEATPILYQNLTNRFFRAMVKKAFRLDSSTATPTTVPALTCKDRNALRYMLQDTCADAFARR